jgi:hypothetical protein
MNNIATILSAEPPRSLNEAHEQGRDTATGQDMGLLPRIDPENDKIRYDDRKGSSGYTEKSVSKDYIATFSISNEKIAVIGLHLLAQPASTQRRDKRQAQADAIHAMALEEQKDRRGRGGVPGTLTGKRRGQTKGRKAVSVKVEAGGGMLVGYDHRVIHRSMVDGFRAGGGS